MRPVGMRPRGVYPGVTRAAATAGWGLAALGLGAAASALTIELGRGPVLDAEHRPDPEAVDRAASEGEASAGD